MARFAYYDRLRADSKRTYRRSDAIERVEVRDVATLEPLVGAIEPEVTGGVARVTLWMRTAQREQVVKFRTFLRTLVHELCHHYDYEHFGLAETFHTQGFYNRESALVRELLGETRRGNTDETDKTDEHG